MAETLLEPSLLRTLDQLTLSTRRAIAGDIQGERRSPKRGSSVEFADYRPYTPGDDFRQIDWKLYGRMERFFLKLFVAEEELTVHLLLDTSASMDWGEPHKLNYARRAAAAYGYVALSGLDRVAVAAFGGGGGRLRGVRGRRGALTLFDFLSTLPAGGGTSLGEACRRYAQSTTAGGPLLLCSDLMDPHWQEALKALTTRPFEVTILHTLAPQELRPELEGDLRLLDAEGGEPIEISADAELMRRYDQNLRSWQAEIEQFCHGRGMTYIPVDTAIPLEDLLLSTLRQRGVLR
ncbi:MAG: DUF58 domain-containing protein [Roseiflexaceae bacterium]